MAAAAAEAYWRVGLAAAAVGSKTARVSSVMPSHRKAGLAV